MTCEIINIGDELLIGQVVNTNASWMAEQLNLIGVNVQQVTVVSDSADAIENAVKRALLTHDVVLLSGGLGPTKDDITKTTLAQMFNADMVIHEPTMQRNRLFFEGRNLPFTDINRKQAEAPNNCIVLDNLCGTAPGMWFDINGKIVVSLAGVPYEMKQLLQNEVLPRLQQRNETVILHKTVMTTGMGESFVAQRLETWEVALPAHIRLAYLPSPGYLRLRLSAFGNDKTLLQSELDRELSVLQSLIPDLIFGYDNQLIEEVVLQMLLQRQQTVSTAESCTGGAIAQCLTSLSGSSKVFKGSIVAYSNDVKQQILGVKADTLQTYGAVSEQTVIEMAQAVRQLLHTDYGIATSGIAGPTGGTPDKPIGMVWIAVASAQRTIAQQFQFADNRQRNIVRTTVAALNFLRTEIHN